MFRSVCKLSGISCDLHVVQVNVIMGHLEDMLEPRGKGREPWIVFVGMLRQNSVQVTFEGFNLMQESRPSTQLGRPLCKHEVAASRAQFHNSF